jgi:hypothetical protein
MAANVVAPVTPKVVLKVPEVADNAAIVDAPVTERVVENAPDVALKAAIVDAPVTDKVVEKAPLVADNAAIVDAPTTVKVLEADSVVKAPAAGVVPPIAGGAANTEAKLPGTIAVLALGAEPITASALVARYTIPFVPVEASGAPAKVKESA